MRWLHASADPQQAVGVELQVLRPEELAGVVAVAAPLRDELAVGRQLLDAVPFAVLGDVVVGGGVADDVGHEAELAGALAHRAAERGVREQLAGRRVGEDSVVVRVGDHQVAVDRADRQAGWPAGLLFGRLPTADEVAVGVEHLDAGRHVDDVELVLLVDRDRARFAELAFAAAEASPHLLRRTIGGRTCRTPPHRGRERGGGRQLVELAPIELVRLVA